MKIAIISDIHEDIVSLHKAARLIEKRGCHEVVCLGDIVGFSVPFYKYLDTRDAKACVVWVRDHCKYSVVGNHDLFAVRKPPQHRAGDFQIPENWYQLTFQERRDLSGGAAWLYEDHELSALLSEEAVDYLIGLPEQLVIEEGGVKCLLTHFIAPDITGSGTRFLVDQEGLSAHYSWMNALRCHLGFSGHMHGTGLIRPAGRHLENIGFGRKVRVSESYWAGSPAISEAGKGNGFLIWDTEANTMEAVSLKSRLNITTKGQP